MKSKHSLLSREAEQQKEETKRKLTRGHKLRRRVKINVAELMQKSLEPFLNSGINMATT